MRKSSVPKSVIFIATCEQVLCVLFCFFGVFFGFLGAVVSGKRSSGVLGSLVSLALASFCYFVAAGLKNGKRWGWFASFVIVGLVLTFGVDAVWSAFYPTGNLIGEEIFSLGTGVILVGASSLG